MKRPHLKILGVCTTKLGTPIGTSHDFLEKLREVLLLYKRWFQWDWYDQAHTNYVLYADTPIWSRSFHFIIERDIILSRE
jgi:hypothetical protein